MAAGVGSGSPGIAELVLLLNVSVVAAAIYFAGRRGIKSAVAQRSLDVAQKLSTAKKELVDVEERLKKIKADYENLAAKKQQVLDSVRIEAERVAKQIVEDTKKSADQILADAELASRTEVLQATKKIRQSLVEQTFDKTLSQFEGSTSSALQSKTEMHDRLFEKFISEIPAQLNSVRSSNHGA